MLLSRVTRKENAVGLSKTFNRKSETTGSLPEKSEILTESCHTCIKYFFSHHDLFLEYLSLSLFISCPFFRVQSVSSMIS